MRLIIKKSAAKETFFSYPRVSLIIAITKTLNSLWRESEATMSRYSAAQVIRARFFNSVLQHHSPAELTATTLRSIILARFFFLAHRHRELLEIACAFSAEAKPQKSLLECEIPNRHESDNAKPCQQLETTELYLN